MHLVAFGEILCLLSANFSLVLKINFVAHHDDLDVLVCVLKDRLHPLAHTLERLFISDIEGYQHAVCLLVERVSH